MWSMGLDDELLHPAKLTTEAASTTSDQVRTRDMKRFLSEADAGSLSCPERFRRGNGSASPPPVVTTAPRPEQGWQWEPPGNVSRELVPDRWGHPSGEVRVTGPGPEGQRSRRVVASVVRRGREDRR